MAARISVLCPVYNGEKTLARAVDSIRRQSETDWELILLDDASTDGSGELCRALAADEPRIRVERHPHNRGLGAAMTTLASMATGRYLAIQEQDDVSAPDRLELEAALLDARPDVDLVSGIAEWVDAEGHRLRLFPGLLANGGQYPQEPRELVRYLLLEQCKIVNAGCLFRRRLLKTPGLETSGVFFDSEARMSADWQFFLRLAHHHRVWGLDRIVVSVARDSGRESLTAKKELQFAEARRCLAIIRRDFENDPASPVDRRLMRRALATQLLLEARHYGGFLGARRHLEALLHDPRRADIWRSFGELAARGLARGRRSRS